MKNIRLWQWVVAVLVLWTAGSWEITGQDPITAMRNGFTDGYQAASK
jgi:hypothetical protein